MGSTSASTVRVRGKKHNGFEKREAAENRMINDLMLMEAGQPRYVVMGRKLCEELALIPQTREAADRAKFDTEKWATIGDLVALKAKMYSRPETLTDRKVTLRLPYKRAIFVTPNEARSLCQELSDLIQTQLVMEKEATLQTVLLSAEEKEMVEKREDVHLGSVFDRMSDKLQTLVIGLGLGFRDDESGQAMIGIQSIGTLFARLCM